MAQAMDATADLLTLHQFQASHYNEKIRWALAFKGLAHERISYLPGPHARTIRRLSGGPTTTPLLQHAGGFVSGSAAIIDFLEQQHPDPALYPADPELRAQALALQARWDEQVGPAVRTVVFSVFVDEPGYLCATFARGKPALKRAGYRALLPLAIPLIRKVNGVYPDTIEQSLQQVDETLKELAGAVERSPYLIGDTFSVADLTAASLLAPLANPDHPDMKRIEPIPPRLTHLLARWDKHPALTWVRHLYARHRAASATA